jgi:hypothetical protein
MPAGSRRQRRDDTRSSDGLSVLVATEARLAGELTAARDQAAAIVDEARRRAELPDTLPDAAAGAEEAAIEADLARELIAIEEDLARRLAAHAEATRALEELARHAIDRLLARVAGESST